MAFFLLSCLSHRRTNGTVLDANDESLQRYKESLGLSGGKDLSDPNDPRVCIINSLTMESPGREPVVVDLSKPGSETELKAHPFKIKQGATFTMVATFKVQHEILSGLHYVQSIKRKGIPVPGGKTSEMIVRSPSVPQAVDLTIVKKITGQLCSKHGQDASLRQEVYVPLPTASMFHRWPSPIHALCLP
jgi:RHO protein GDP dissociation inhibitor